MNWFTRLFIREPFELPADLSDRLQHFRVDVEQFAREYKRDGLSFAKGYLKELEEGADLFSEWFPRLKRHEAKCQRKRQYPELRFLSEADRAEYVGVCDGWVT